MHTHTHIYISRHLCIYLHREEGHQSAAVISDSALGIFPEHSQGPLLAGTAHCFSSDADPSTFTSVAAFSYVNERAKVVSNEASAGFGLCKSGLLDDSAGLQRLCRSQQLTMQDSRQTLNVVLTKLTAVATST